MVYSMMIPLSYIPCISLDSIFMICLYTRTILRITGIITLSVLIDKYILSTSKDKKLNSALWPI